jgi:hypothetical protein
MRLLKPAHSGYLSDPEMYQYWTLHGSGATLSYTHPEAQGVSNVVGFANIAAGRPLFGGTFRGTGALGPDADGALQSAVVGATGSTLFASNAWTVSFWYSVVNSVTRTGNFIELSLNDAPFGDSQRMPFAIRFSVAEGGDSIDLILATELPGGTLVTDTVSSFPLIGMMTVVRNGSVTSVYHNGNKVVDNPTLAYSAAVGTDSNMRFRFGRSARTPTITSLKDDRIQEVAIWRAALPARRVMELYDDCVSPVDLAVVAERPGVQVQYRVLIARPNGDFIDYSIEDGRDWVKSVEIEDSVDDPTRKATVSLMRAVGPLRNLSPLGQGLFEGQIDLRRRVQIERRLGGDVRWDLRFDGYIDTFNIDEDTITLSCTDLAAPLTDQPVLDAKSYYYPTVEALSEQLAENIINDQAPAYSTATSRVSVGYKGGTPQVFTDYGTTSTRWYRNSGILNRYYDLSQGTVMAGIQDLANSTGSQLRYRHYAPLGSFRLEFAPPQRTESIYLQSCRVRGNVSIVTTDKPHGLRVGQAIMFDTTSATWVGAGYVGRLLGTNQFVLEGHPASAGGNSVYAAGLNDTIKYDPGLFLTSDKIKDVNAVEHDISRIRNHILVRFNRDVTPSVYTVTLSKSAGTEPVLVDVPSGVNLSRLDPDNVGIEFSIEGATGLATVANTDWEGTILGSSRIQTSVGVAGSAFSGLFGTMRCDYFRYNEASALSTPSIAKYGLLPAQIFEAATSNIKDPNDAQKLANYVLHDLSEPQADWEFKLNFPSFLDLGDTVQVEPDGVYRWTTSRRGSITRVREVKRAGDYYEEVTVRNAPPTLGVVPWGRILNTPDSMRNNAPTAAITAYADPNNRGGIRFRWDTTQREANEPGWRLDTTEIHLSTRSWYACNANTLVTTVRGNTADVFTSGNNQPLVAGVTWYPRLRFRDVDGNISLGSTAGLSPVEVRFASTNMWWANVRRATSATVDYMPAGLSDTFVMPFDSVATPGIAFPAAAYDTATQRFKFPRAGRVRGDGFMHLSVEGLKTGMGDWYILASAEVWRSASLLRTIPLWRMTRAQVEAVAGVSLGGTFAPVTLGNSFVGCTWDFNISGIQDDEIRIVLYAQSAVTAALRVWLNGQATPAADSYSNFAFIDQF